jgi:hypothetical protein
MISIVSVLAPLWPNTIYCKAQLHNNRWIIRRLKNFLNRLWHISITLIDHRRVYFASASSKPLAVLPASASSANSDNYLHKQVKPLFDRLDSRDWNRRRLFDAVENQNINRQRLFHARGRFPCQFQLSIFVHEIDKVSSTLHEIEIKIDTH